MRTQPDPSHSTIGGEEDWRGFLRHGENIFVAVTLAALLVLPLTEILLRPGLLGRFFPVGIPGGAIPIVRHLVLFVAMLGGALAAREQRLLSLSTVTTFLKGRWKTAATILSSSFAVAISALLCVAGVITIKMTTASATLVGVPIWIIQLILPLGFSVIALRLIWGAGTNWGVRALTFLMAATFVWIGVCASIPPGHRIPIIWILPTALVVTILLLGVAVVTLLQLWYATRDWVERVLAVSFIVILCTVILYTAFGPPIPRYILGVTAMVALLIATVLGTPIFTTLGGAALILFWSDDRPIAAVALNHLRIVTQLELAAIPLFTLAGYFLAEGGASKRLIRVFQALFGQLRGGPAIVTAVVCAFFTSFTGASGVTILALGGLLMPVLLSARYSPRNAIGLLTGAGSLGLLFPPCLPLILYAIVATMTATQLETDVSVEPVSIEHMFLGGLIPGCILVALTAIWGIRQAPKTDTNRSRFDRREAIQALWIAKWELLLPVVAVVALFSGFATAEGAAAVTAFYALVIETLVYRDLRIKTIHRVMAECGLLIGGVLLILGVAMGLTNYLIDAEVPHQLADWVQHSIESPLVFLLMLNLFLLVVGCLMDIYSAIIVVAPLIIPVAVAFDIHPVHLGIIFLANMELGYLTPPVGMNIFLSALRFEKSVPEVIRSVIPMFFVLLIGVLLITYIPQLTTFLPSFLDN